MSCFYQAPNANQLRKVPSVVRLLNLTQIALKQIVATPVSTEGKRYAHASSFSGACSLVNDSCETLGARGQAWYLFKIDLLANALLANAFLENAATRVERDFRSFTRSVLNRCFALNQFLERNISSCVARNILAGRWAVLYRLRSLGTTLKSLPLHSDIASFRLNTSVQPTSMNME